MNGRRLMILQLAGFVPRGTLCHGYSLVTVKHDEKERCGRVRVALKGFSPLLLWNDNVKRCTQAPGRESVG